MVPVTDFAIQYGEHVQRARREGRPVVALESTIISHGLPRPDNLRVAREIEQTVRDHGAAGRTNPKPRAYLRPGTQMPRWAVSIRRRTMMKNCEWTLPRDAVD